MSEEYQKAQAELVSGHIAKQDIVITTALIPGRPAPRLISDAQIATMRPGSVIVDLAVESGGNVEGSVAGEWSRSTVSRLSEQFSWRDVAVPRLIRAQPGQLPHGFWDRNPGCGPARRRDCRSDPAYEERRNGSRTPQNGQ
jgi:hypothetical protein